MPKKVVSINEVRGLRRLTPEILAELLAVHAHCIYDQQGKCTLTVFVKQLCWELNQAMGCAGEEDKGFRRYNEMCAARPLGTHCFSLEDE